MAAYFGYPLLEQIHADDFTGSDGGLWHHEGIGGIERRGDGVMSLACVGSVQGSQGCMAFFRPTLPDQVCIEYTLTVLSHGGLVINYIALRGVNGEDAIADRDRLEPRTGIMANYYARRWGLQSYHVSVSRFNDAGEHTGTCNWRRNPGCLIMAHGFDAVRELHRPYRVTLIKDAGHLALFVDGQHLHGFIDRDTRRGPIPDEGKFGFRLIGSDVAAEVGNFRVSRIGENKAVWGDAAEDHGNDKDKEKPKNQ